MKLALILLAAGDSRRFDGNKLLHLIHGKMMYEHIVDELEPLSKLFQKRIMVTQYPAIINDMSQRGYHVVENAQSCLGISHSIQLALEAAGDQMDAYCFVVCDQPYLKGGTVEGLIKGWKDSKKGIGCPCYKGELGNPVIFSSCYVKELMKLTGDTGGKRVVKSHLQDVCLFELDHGGELVDIDERHHGDLY